MDTDVKVRKNPTKFWLYRTCTGHHTR